jgi:solute carrier family 35 (GDP-fucose transporter), member C1
MQIARGLQLPLTIIVSTVNTHSIPSWKVIGAASIVTFGFFVGVAPSSLVPASSSPSMLSLFYGFLSSLFIAFHAVLIKTSLPHCDNSTIQLAWWQNAGSAVFLLPFVILNGEPEILRSKFLSAEWKGTTFIWGSTVTGIFGFLLCVAGLLSIKVTSPITHMFSSVSSCFTSYLSSVHILIVGRSLCAADYPRCLDIP